MASPSSSSLSSVEEALPPETMNTHSSEIAYSIHNLRAVMCFICKVPVLADNPEMSLMMILDTSTSEMHMSHTRCHVVESKKLEELRNAKVVWQGGNSTPKVASSQWLQELTRPYFVERIEISPLQCSEPQALAVRTLPCFQLPSRYHGVCTQALAVMRIKLVVDSGWNGFLSSPHFQQVLSRAKQAALSLEAVHAMVYATPANNGRGTKEVDLVLVLHIDAKYRITNPALMDVKAGRTPFATFFRNSALPVFRSFTETLNTVYRNLEDVLQHRCIKQKHLHPNDLYTLPFCSVEGLTGGQLHEHRSVCVLLNAHRASSRPLVVVDAGPHHTVQGKRMIMAKDVSDLNLVRSDVLVPTSIVSETVDDVAALMTPLMDLTEGRNRPAKRGWTFW